MREPKYCRHKPTNRGYSRCKAYFGNKVHYWPGPYRSEQSVAAFNAFRIRFIQDQESARRGRSIQRTFDGTISDLMKEYFLWARTYYGPRGGGNEYDNIRYAARPMRKLFGGTAAADFGPLKLKAVQSHMVELGWSRNHINASIRKIRGIFAWAVSEQLIPGSVLTELKTVKGLREGKTKARETEPVRPVEWSTVQEVLPFVAPMIRSMLELQHLTAMRSDELTAMRPVDIARDKDVWLYVPPKHKTKWRRKMKVICIGPKGQAILQRYWPEKPEQYIFAPLTAMLERKKVKPGYRDRYDAHSFQRVINYGFENMAKALGHGKRPRVDPDNKKSKRVKLISWLKECGIEYWHPHQLRHTRATIARAEYGPEGAEAVTGNSFDAAMLYAEKSVELAMRIAKETG